MQFANFDIESSDDTHNVIFKLTNLIKYPPKLKIGWSLYDDNGNAFEGITYRTDSVNYPMFAVMINVDRKYFLYLEQINNNTDVVLDRAWDFFNGSELFEDNIKYDIP